MPPTEPPPKTRSGNKKDKQDAPEKPSKEPKAGKSTDKTDEPPKVQELGIQEIEEAMVNPTAFQVAFYMKHFRVSDIIVKLVGNKLIIDACHREHADEHGLVSRSVVRKHKLPQDINLDTLTVVFTANGFLVVYAERLVEKDEQN